jgi:hypothetical protein
MPDQPILFRSTDSSIIKVSVLPINKKTISGKVYTKSVIKEAIRKYFNLRTELLVTNKIQQTTTDINSNDVIGYCRKNDCQVTNTDLITSITFVNLQMAIDVEKVLVANQAKLTVVGTGQVIDNIARKFTLVYIALS